MNSNCFRLHWVWMKFQFSVFIFTFNFYNTHIVFHPHQYIQHFCHAFYKNVHLNIGSNWKLCRIVLFPFSSSFFPSFGFVTFDDFSHRNTTKTELFRLRPAKWLTSEIKITTDEHPCMVFDVGPDFNKKSFR